MCARRLRLAGVLAWAGLLLAGALGVRAAAAQSSPWCVNSGGYGLWVWQCAPDGCAAHPAQVLTNTLDGMAEVPGDIFSLRLRAGQQPVFALVPPRGALAHEVSVATVMAPVARALRSEAGFRIDDEENVASITQALVAGQPLVLKYFDIVRATQTAAVEILPQGFVQTFNEALRWANYIAAERDSGREACVAAAPGPQPSQAATPSTSP